MKTMFTFAVAVMAAAQVFAQVKYTEAFYMPEFSACISRTADGEAFWTCGDERQLTTPKDLLWKVCFSDGVILASNVMNVGTSPDEGMNDMEAMAADQHGGFFVLTSQSLTSGLEDKANRKRLAHFHSNGQLDQYKDNLRGSMESQFTFLTNYWAMAPKLGGVDVEGIAYEPSANRLWFGLRGPLVGSNPAVPGDRAVLLKMNNVLSGTNFNYASYTWDATPVYLDLGGEGVRDLFYDTATTNLFILTGKLEANQSLTDGQGNTYTNRQACHLLAYKPATGALTYCMRFPQVPTTPTPNGDTCEAEGICAITLDSVKKLLVTYDSKTNGVYQAFDFPDPTTFATPDTREGFVGQ